MERIINSNVERMGSANMEKMMQIMTEQFFQLASSSRKSGTFPSQPELNPKGHASSSSGANPSESVSEVTTRKVVFCSNFFVANFKLLQ